MNKVTFCNKHNQDKKLIGKTKKIYRCYDCNNEYRRAYNLLNKEKIKQKNKEYNDRTRERRQEWVRQDRIANPDRYRDYSQKYHHINYVQYQARRTARKYGLTYEAYVSMIEASNHKCAICGCEEKRRLGREERLTQLSVDHDHNTGKVRGLVCYGCNLIIGYANDNIEVLQSAINYLQSHKHL